MSREIIFLGEIKYRGRAVYEFWIGPARVKTKIWRLGAYHIFGVHLLTTFHIEGIESVHYRQ